MTVIAPSGVLLAQVISDVTDRAVEVGTRLGVAVAVFALIVVIARLIRPVLRAWLARGGRPSRARVFSGLASILVVVAGTLIAATIAFPSVEIADVLASVGLLSVAVGFAFKDVLENVLAGVMLILRDPFQSGDEIRVGDVEGTVEGITVRETLLRTFDGQRVLVPNAKVFTDIIEVQTHFPLVRQTIEMDLDLSADLPALRAQLAEAIGRVQGVAPVPSPDVIALHLDPELRIRCRFWCAPQRSVVTSVRDRAVEAIRAVLLEHPGALARPELVVDVVAPEVTRPDRPGPSSGSSPG